MRGARGFTLIELILVTVIIGILAAMVVPVYANRVSRAKFSAAKGDIAALESAIRNFALDHDDTLPRTLAELTDSKAGRVYLAHPAKDPWSNEYQYLPGSDPQKGDFKLFSSGKNGISGDADDIDAETPDPWQTPNAKETVAGAPPSATK